MITVKILEIGVPDSNGRIYPMEAVEAMIMQSREREILGQLESTSFAVNSDQASHAIKNLRIENLFLVCDVEALNTPNGNTLSSIIDSLEFYPRGTGIIEEGQVRDFHLISIDATAWKLPKYKMYDRLSYT